jgi:hypothetical protein
MEGLPRQEDGTRFIGTIERFEEGWRASFRLRVPSEVFAQPGQTEISVPRKSLRETTPQILPLPTTGR